MKRTNTAKWMEKQQRWQINVQKDGVRKSFYSGTPGRTGQREANKKADLWLDEGVENPRAKVAEMYEKYLDEVKKETSVRNHSNKVQRWMCYIEPVIGVRMVSAIGDADIKEVLDIAFSRRHLAKKTLMNIRSDMTAFIKFCRRSKVTSYVPDDVSIPAAAQVVGKKILQPQDLQKLFTSDETLYRGKIIKDPYIQAYRFQALTGLRPGEILGLKPEDYVAGYVYIRRSITVDGIVTAGKNRNAARAVALQPLAEEIVQKQLQATPGCEHIFDILNERHYRHMLKRYCKYNGVADIVPYALRHTFVSVAKHQPEGTVKSVVGHSKNMDTFGVYGHFFEGEDREIANALGQDFAQILNCKK